MPTSRTPRKTSIHPAPKRVTYLYDRHVPVALRLRGLGARPTVASAEMPLQVHHLGHVSSPHVLALKEEVVKTTPAKETVPDFDAFAHEFFKQLATSDDTPQTEPLDTSLLSGQLKENDKNKAKRHITLPRLRTHAVKELHDDLIELSDIIEDEVEVVVKKAKPAVKKMNRLKKRLRSRLPVTGYRLPLKRYRLPKINPFLHPSLRGIGVFVLLSFIFVLPLQAMNSRSSAQTIREDLIGESAEAVALFEEAANATSRTDFVSAREQFAQAGNRLATAQATLDTLGIGTRALAALLPSQGGTLKTGQALLDLGYELSISAERISDGLSAIADLTDTSLGTKVAVLERYLGAALPHLSAANEALGRINPDLIPEEHMDRFAELSRILPDLEAGLHQLEDFSSALKAILGNEEKRRYLFVFQNDTEIRPSGGFIGSFAEVDVYRGEVEHIYLPGDGSYNLQGALGLHVAAPQPLQLINARWEFQDANWSPDFKTSAEKLLEFHDAAGGPTVDGVVAINARFVADLLALLGPIEMPDYDRTITADNFLIEAQKIVELEYDREENKPKQFLSDLAPELLERIGEIDSETFVPLLEILRGGLEQKDIQLSFTDARAQESIRALGWSGELARVDDDYLMVVNANIGGQKTDAVIEETVDVDSHIGEDGRIQNTVTITRRHHGIAGAPFTGANNVNYVQLFVPRGSHLIDVRGANPPDAHLFENPEHHLEEDLDLAFQTASRFKGSEGTDVSETLGKTVFGNWTQTKPGQTSQISFTYELPWTLSFTPSSEGLFARAGALLGLHTPESHTLTIEAQSGMRNRVTTVSLSLPERGNIRWSTDLIEARELTRRIEGAQDGFIGVLFENIYE